MAPIIFHIDVNSAYLSWTAVEQLKNGAAVDLREIPAIIGGDQKSRHGVVLAKSPAAKRYGIRTGEPVANAFRKCPNLAMYPPDHKMYREKSRRLMEYLRTFTKEIEQVSVDECYMDFTGIADRWNSPVDGAVEIKDGIKERFGFTVNIGISTNKLLAKMASDFEKPDRIHTLYPEEIKEKMWPLPIGELYMAGKSSVEVLKKLEINTIGDLAQSDPRLIMLHLKSHGKMLWEFANGIGTSVVQSEPDEAKGIGNSTTLSEDAATMEEIRPVFERLAQSVGGRLKKAERKPAWSAWKSNIMISGRCLIRYSWIGRPMIPKCSKRLPAVCFWKCGAGSRCVCSGYARPSSRMKQRRNSSPSLTSRYRKSRMKNISG